LRPSRLANSLPATAVAYPGNISLLAHHPAAWPTKQPCQPLGRTDHLIDQFAYQLFGLTEEEFAVFEAGAIHL
jgi:hypothetical protein